MTNWISLDIFGYTRGGNVPAPKNEDKQMEIKGNVHLFFEQSGVFKNEFKKMGFCAFDYDIQNNFGETDYIIDLFVEIEKAFEGKYSIFDKITNNDLIIAFFPCIMFSCLAQINITLKHFEYFNKTIIGAGNYILDRIEKREFFYKTLVKFCCVCIDRKIKMVFENPYSQNSYLKGNFIKKPDIIDKDRTRRGDYFVKPTAFWFFNFEPTNLFTYQPCSLKKRKYFAIHQYQLKLKTKEKIARSSKKNGICSEERSMIAPDYARNFICDFILGKKQDIGQLSLF